MIFGANHGAFMSSFSTMDLKGKQVETLVMRKRLRDEPSDDEQTTQLSGSLEVLEVSLDPEATVPQTREAA